MKRIMTKAMAAAGALLVLAGCGEVTDKAAELQAKADAAIAEGEVANAVASAVDVEAARALAEGAAREQLREVLPLDEAAAVAAIVDEQALVNGLERVVRGTAPDDGTAAAPAE